MSNVRPLPAELEDRLARYRAGEMSDDERAAFEHEILASDAIAEEFYAEVSLDRVRRGEPAQATLPRDHVIGIPSARPARRGGARQLLALAAGILAVSALALWRLHPPGTRPGSDSMRGESTLTALEPSGTLGAPPERFRWSRESGAANYRVELYDTNGNALGTAVTPDTVLAFRAVARAAVLAGEWRVVAIGADGLDRPARSRASFRVEPR